MNKTSPLALLSAMLSSAARVRENGKREGSLLLHPGVRPYRMPIGSSGLSILVTTVFAGYAFLATLLLSKLMADGRCFVRDCGRPRLPKNSITVPHISIVTNEGCIVQWLG